MWRLCVSEMEENKNLKRKIKNKIEMKTLQATHSGENLALPSPVCCCCCCCCCLASPRLSFNSPTAHTAHTTKTKWGKRFHEKLLHTDFLWFRTYIKPGNVLALNLEVVYERSQQRSEFFFWVLSLSLFPQTAVPWQQEFFEKKNLFS